MRRAQLSSGCTSFDQFRNFAARGNAFRELMLRCRGWWGRGEARVRVTTYVLAQPCAAETAPPMLL